jgi:hypothetical protein
MWPVYERLEDAFAPHVRNAVPFRRMLEPIARG